MTFQCEFLKKHIIITYRAVGNKIYAEMRQSVKDR